MLFKSDLESDDSMLDIYGAGLCTFNARSISFKPNIDWNNIS